MHTETLPDISVVMPVFNSAPNLERALELGDIAPAVAGPNLDLLALNEALEKLERHDSRKAELVKLRFLAGLTTEQAAEALGISTSTADNDWAYARCWLRLEIAGSSRGGPH